MTSISSAIKNSYIDPEWLKEIRDGSFYYPCAGCDWNEAVEVFNSHLAAFTFCDLYTYDHYLRGDKLLKVGQLELQSEEILGNAHCEVEQLENYRWVEPSWLHQVYYDKLLERRIRVVIRRGFGQFGLLELANNSLSVFMHRGDSSGECGSNVYYFANQKARHPPLANLFDTLQLKLKDAALIISDGSNARPKFLRKFHRSKVSSVEAFLQLRMLKPKNYGQFSWKAVGYLPEKYGPTIVWGLRRRVC